jgi:hypothetical protein
MEPIDFKSSGSPPLQGAAFSEDFQIQQKKLRRQTGVEQQPELKSPDVFVPSPEAEKLQKTKFDAFLEIAKNHILKMDRDSETFLPDATSHLVRSALEQEYGDGIAQDPGYPQMKKVLTDQLLRDPNYREMVEEFIEIITLSE